MSAPDSPWLRGRLDQRVGPALVLFGRMYEDAAIEQALFPPGAEVCCVASGGCTALALCAAGYAVTAVDCNPAQIRYLAERAAGRPPRDGYVEQLMAVARRRLRLSGVSVGELRALLSLDDPAVQRAALEAPERALLRAALGDLLGTLGSAGTAEPATRGADLAPFMIDRLLRGMARHSNRHNAFAWRLLLGEDPPAWSAPTAPAAAPPAAAPLRLCESDLATFLESLPPHRFTAFSLSNLVDVQSAAEQARLLTALSRAAAPGAVVVSRSLAPAQSSEEAEWAGRDRALLWGRITITRLPSLQSSNL